MTLDLQGAGIPANPSAVDQPERPADPRPAWERVAYTWLAREVDAGRPVDPTALAAEVSVAPGFARDLVRVLRAHRQRDPALSELRARTGSPTPTWSASSRAASHSTRPSWPPEHCRACSATCRPAPSSGR
jgi:hypothetical protein